MQIVSGGLERVIKSMMGALLSFVTVISKGEFLSFPLAR